MEELLQKKFKHKKKITGALEAVVIFFAFEGNIQLTRIERIF